MKYATIVYEGNQRGEPPRKRAVISSGAMSKACSNSLHNKCTSLKCSCKCHDCEYQTAEARCRES